MIPIRISFFIPMTILSLIFHGTPGLYKTPHTIGNECVVSHTLFACVGNAQLGYNVFGEVF